MLATFKFDVEDIYYPHACGVDDLAGWTAEIMTEVGLPATLCVMGAKARTMKERGREDVLAAMARHELASHQVDNTHPTLIERLADKGWDDGLAAAAEYEAQVTRDFQFAYGREPAGMSRHNTQWAPQHVALAGQRGIPYMGNVVGVPGTEQPCWYAGAICLDCTHGDTAAAPGELPGLYGIPTNGEFGGFDSRYCCDDDFEERLAQMIPHFDECKQRGVLYMLLFGAHPVKIRARGFMEHYTLAGGKDRTIADLGFLYGLGSRKQEAIAKKNFRRYCETVRDYPGLEVLRATEVARRFSTQTADITIDELNSYANAVVAAKKVILHRTFSPAELLIGLADSLLVAGPSGLLPDAVERLNLIGPTEMPTVATEVITLTHSQLLDACRQAANFAREHGRIPGNVHIDNNRIGAGQFIVIAAKAFAAQARHDRYAVYDMIEAPRYPDIAHLTSSRLWRTHGENPRYDPDLSIEKLVRHAMLQTWSLKPAWQTPPRGKLSCAIRRPVAV